MWGAAMFFTSLVVCATSVPTCEPSGPTYLCHETDPTQYYVCVGSRATLMPCPAGLHFDRANTMCVYPGDADCSYVGQPTSPPDPETVECTAGEVSHHCYLDDPHNGVTCQANGTKVDVSCENDMWHDGYFSNITGECLSYNQGDKSPCNPSTWDDPACPPSHVGMLQHPDKCQFYIRCTPEGQQEGRLGRTDRPYDECPYPKMFSTTTNQCEDFWLVACHRRKVVKEPCAYLLSGVPDKPPQRRRRTPSHAGGPPCELHDPSCLTLPDGLHPHPYMTHRYIECRGERTMAVHQCSNGQLWQQDQMECACPEGTELQDVGGGASGCVSVPTTLPTPVAV